MITLNIQCRICGNEHRVSVREEDYEKFKHNEGFVQDIFPYLTPAKRELLISGVCPVCWDKMFSGED